MSHLKTAYVFAPGTRHTAPNHPEYVGRIDAIDTLLRETGVYSELDLLSYPQADVEWVLAVHSLAMVEHVRRGALVGGGRLDADTYVTSESYKLALDAAGACCRLVEAIVRGEASNGLGVVRPPGHHAESDKVGGFCLFNNAAVAARYVQEHHGVGRVAIFDFDVHHGNGTQDIFYDDSSVLFISTHQFAPFFYPGTGTEYETGEEAGFGYNMNIPLPEGVGDEGFMEILRVLIGPKLRSFQPDLILISAGFDAHWQDPLAQQGMSLTGYNRIVRWLLALADELCGGRIAFILEGGYFLPALSHGVLNTAYALLGRDDMCDPLGPNPTTEANLNAILTRLKHIHLRK